MQAAGGPGVTPFSSTSSGTGDSLTDTVCSICSPGAVLLRSRAPAPTIKWALSLSSHGTPERQTRCVNDVGRLARPVHCCQNSLIDTSTGRLVSHFHSKSGPRSTVRTTAAASRADCSPCMLVSPPLSTLYSTATLSR